MRLACVWIRRLWRTFTAVYYTVYVCLDGYYVTTMSESSNCHCPNSSFCSRAWTQNVSKLSFQICKQKRNYKTLQIITDSVTQSSLRFVGRRLCVAFIFWQLQLHFSIHQGIIFATLFGLIGLIGLWFSLLTLASSSTRATAVFHFRPTDSVSLRLRSLQWRNRLLRVGRQISADCASCPNALGHPGRKTSNQWRLGMDKNFKLTRTSNRRRTPNRWRLRTDEDYKPRTPNYPIVPKPMNHTHESQRMIPRVQREFKMARNNSRVPRQF